MRSSLQSKGGGGGPWPMDLLHQSIQLDLTHGDDIEGHCTIKAVPRQAGADQFPLHLKALTVDSVSSPQGPLSFVQAGDDLIITLNAPLGLTDTVVLTVHYGGDPIIDPSGFGGFYTSGPVAYNLGVAFTHQPHSYGRAWFPCVDNFIERNNYDFLVRSPAGRNAWCNGHLIADSIAGDGTNWRHWRIDETMPAYLASVASSDYTVVRDTFPSISGTAIPVDLVARPPDTTNMKNSFLHLPDAFALFEQWFGAYRWNKVGYVLTPQGAMEHSTSIHYPQFIASGTLQYESTMAHELAHQWFGDLVTCSRAEEMYINEGFAEYLSYLFIEQVSGTPQYMTTVRNNHRKMLQEAHMKDEGWWALADVPQAWTYGEHSYNKGADVLHTLRNYLGDDLFQQGLTSFLDQYAFQDVNTDQLRDHLTASTGVEMADFFADWVLQPGWAAFEVDSFTVDPTPLPGGLYATEVFVQQKQRGPAAPYHNVPLTVTCMDAMGNSWTSATPFMVGGDMDIISTTLPFVPEHILLNADERISLAVTRDHDIFTGPGTRVYSITDLRVTVVSTPSPFSIDVEEYWVAADEETAEAYAYVVSPDRYWRILGNLPAEASVSARFVYDGRPAPAISFDAGLMQDFQGTVFREDSLVLLYRPDARTPWSRFPTQTLNTIGSVTDRVGRIDITNLLVGEYAFAWRKSSTGILDRVDGGSKWSIYPSPTSNSVTVAREEDGGPGVVEVLDVKGCVVRTLAMRSPTVTVDLSGLDAAVYPIRFVDDDGNGQWIGQVVVE